jgi:hypothetical protein
VEERVPTGLRVIPAEREIQIPRVDVTPTIEDAGPLPVLCREVGDPDLPVAFWEVQAAQPADDGHEGRAFARSHPVDGAAVSDDRTEKGSSTTKCVPAPPVSTDDRFA